MYKKIEHLLQKLAATGFFHIFITDILNKIIFFLCGIILVRILSKEDYGLYTYSNNILSFFLLASGLGMLSAILQLCSEAIDKEKSNGIFLYAAKIGFYFNLVLGITIFLATFIIPFKIAGANNLIKLSMFLPIFIFLKDVNKIYLRYQLRNKEYSYSNVIETIFIFLFSIFGTLLLGVKGVIFGYYFAYFFSILVTAKLFHVPFTILKKQFIDLKTKKSLFHIGFVSMCNNGLAELLYLLDVFILGFIHQNSLVIASYKIATLIPNALSFIPMGVSVYIYPYFARYHKDKKWVKRNYIKILFYMGILNLFLSGSLFIFAPIIIKIFFGSQYLDALLPFRILSISYFFIGTFRTISGNLLVTQKRLKFNFFVTLSSGIINILGNIILISAYGSSGAAISTLIVAIESGLISTIYFFRIVSD